MSDEPINDWELLQRELERSRAESDARHPVPDDDDCAMRLFSSSKEEGRKLTPKRGQRKRK
jgi:hypothetical protein